MAVQSEVNDISKKAIKGLGINNTTFNIEFFYNKDNGDLKIIEVNPRFSGQFGDIYEKVRDKLRIYLISILSKQVDGTNTYDIAVGLACNQQPNFVARQGKYKVAASFVMRVFEDKVRTALTPHTAI